MRTHSDATWQLLGGSFLMFSLPLCSRDSPPPTPLPTPLFQPKNRIGSSVQLFRPPPNSDQSLHELIERLGDESMITPPMSQKRGFTIVLLIRLQSVLKACQLGGWGRSDTPDLVLEGATVGGHSR
ncbi:hypothetical protein TNIN_444861 [Trichonephila inaurata madagascariensis]|uniref:Uncharacterized protein n=1 Tax=Trichonephila inaurata madagascariensis TaxID=2747483 RepID=A0A8X7CMG6_9ARAC|nr:hypothetical protein TNIN_444861 [Trichonephila inaurata madagascariensis]